MNKTGMKKSRNGFTLMEICVAMIVSAIGFFGIGMCIKAFQNQQLRERDFFAMTSRTVAEMERLLDERIPCGDSVGTLQNMPYPFESHLHVEKVPGAISLAWLSVTAERKRDGKRYELKRLVRCTENEKRIHFD